MIGRRCKARERLSRAPLIGRALRDHTKAPSAPDRSQRATFLKRCAAPRAPCSATPPSSSPRRNAPRGPAATAAGAHPDPYRTRKLSRPAPRVLQGRPCGRAGRRRPPGRVARARGGEARTEAPGKGDPSGSPFSFAGLFRAVRTTGLFSQFNGPFLLLQMDNLIFSLGLVARTVDTSAQAGLWGVIRRLVVDNRGNDAHNGRVTKSKHSDEAAHSSAALSFKRRRYEPGH